ncbi:hypothetical protein B0J13DRAFT_137096 [Dactylonectria estremocensis]|uniref:D-xylose 1-dehydrogenase (NADP(+), D-xylono-1,5-lactone-forming) n=1 Tax=Dactylonectria estremocensis TaxID=1079267 RepID=A0A9P9DZS4_9HYPO|nr:hypothetical protein B0J13DRAFT_137096 [Dactylonectria estremocensis]
MSIYTLKWGILATGGIAETFTKDILTNPKLRSEDAVAHEIVAVASSSKKQRAEDFIAKTRIPGNVTAYGSYAELVTDSSVQIVYVATPHSHHFQNAMLALEAGKHVLCEKALTVTASQATKLVDTAREKGVFFMEAVWTRFFPASIKIRELCTSGAIGSIHRVIADISFASGKDDGDDRLEFPDTNRMVNLDLAGGALLDLGVYSLTWVFQILYHLQPENSKEKPVVTSSIDKYSYTGSDESTSILLHFPKHRTTGIATTGLRTLTGANERNEGSPAVVIQGSKGEICVYGPCFKPKHYSVITKDGPETVKIQYPTDPERNGEGHGMYWEADECARCIRDGKVESSTMPWGESLAIMETMDKVLKDGGIVYPEIITTDVFDPQSNLNTGK